MHKNDFTFSKIVSYILHPLLIPTLATAALMMQPGLYPIIIPFALNTWFISVVFIFTLLVPVTGMLLLLKFKAIDSLEMEQRTERTIPLLIASTSFMAMLFTIKTTNMPPVFLYVLYSATFALLGGLLINLFYKISLHTLGWGALLATFIVVSIKLGMPLLNYIVVSSLLSGIVGYARLKQNAHTTAQVYLGYVAGIGVIVLITMLV